MHPTRPRARPDHTDRERRTAAPFPIGFSPAGVRPPPPGLIACPAITLTSRPPCGLHAAHAAELADVILAGPRGQGPGYGLRAPAVPAGWTSSQATESSKLATTTMAQQRAIAWPGPPPGRPGGGQYAPASDRAVNWSLAGTSMRSASRAVNS